MSEAEETPVRSIADLKNRVWHVYVVLEGHKWDPAGEERRRNWLCFEQGKERRWISPVPDGWLHAPESTLRHWLLTAKVDLRG